VGAHDGKSCRFFPGVLGPLISGGRGGQRSGPTPSHITWSRLASDSLGKGAHAGVTPRARLEMAYETCPLRRQVAKFYEVSHQTVSRNSTAMADLIFVWWW
jgi:hypothetical protein